MSPTDPCSTCAFGKSGGAADEARNRLVATTSSVGAAKKVALAKLKDRMRALKPEGPTS